MSATPLRVLALALAAFAAMAAEPASAPRRQADESAGPSMSFRFADRGARLVVELVDVVGEDLLQRLDDDPSADDADALAAALRARLTIVPAHGDAHVVPMTWDSIAGAIVVDVPVPALPARFSAFVTLPDGRLVTIPETGMREMPAPAPMPLFPDADEDASDPPATRP